MTRIYQDLGGLSRLCEHCDNSHVTRVDYLRGFVCEDCDAALDEMLADDSAQRSQDVIEILGN